jgi:hypothetical protein
MATSDKDQIFNVCVAVHQCYNNTKSQLDATITNFIDNYNQLNNFSTKRPNRRQIQTPTLLQIGRLSHMALHISEKKSLIFLSTPM